MHLSQPLTGDTPGISGTSVMARALSNKFAASLQQLNPCTGGEMKEPTIDLVIITENF